MKNKNNHAQLSNSRFITLFISLLLVMVLYPFVGQGSVGTLVLNLFFTLTLISGLLAAATRMRYMVIGSVLGVWWFVLSWIDVFMHEFPVDVLTHISAIVFYGFIAVIILIRITHTRAITAGVLYGAISVYILFGLIWAILFSLFGNIQPGSFFIDPALGNIVLSWPDYMYLSFSTLSTLGYGDIVPVTQPVRLLASLEAVVGVLYLTVLLARLAGLYSMAQQNVKKK